MTRDLGHADAVSRPMPAVGMEGRGRALPHAQIEMIGAPAAQPAQQVGAGRMVGVIAGQLVLKTVGGRQRHLRAVKLGDRDGPVETVSGRLRSTSPMRVSGADEFWRQIDREEPDSSCAHAATGCKRPAGEHGMACPRHLRPLRTGHVWRTSAAAGVFHGRPDVLRLSLIGGMARRGRSPPGREVAGPGTRRTSSPPTSPVPPGNPREPGNSAA